LKQISLTSPPKYPEPTAPENIGPQRAPSAYTGSNAVDKRIAALYAIEKEIRGQPPDQRRAVRQARTSPELAHQTFTDADDLDRAIHSAVENRIRDRSEHPWTKPGISA
jgi:hypothetical protein